MSVTLQLVSRGVCLGPTGVQGYCPNPSPSLGLLVPLHRGRVSVSCVLPRAEWRWAGLLGGAGVLRRQARQEGGAREGELLAP